MSQVETTAKRETPSDGSGAAWPTELPAGKSHRRWSRAVPLLITLAAVALAGLLGWAMWRVYMVAPWTRDGTVRAYVVTMAPEVAGHIVELPVVANQYVRKGDLLLVIDPTNYQIGVDQAVATVQQDQANIQNIDEQITVQQAQVSVNQAQVDQAQMDLRRYQTLKREQSIAGQQAEDQAYTAKTAQANLNLAQRQIEALKAQRTSAEATLAQAQTQLHQAQVNLRRTRIFSPVNGYVTNLLAQVGDYVNVGVNTISLVDADSFWVEGYFEETNFAPISVGDPAQIKLMGYSPIARGHVESISRAINVSNAQPDIQGVATVNPIFTWVELAQRIPVRIHIDEVPKGVQLVQGMTATVQIEPRP
ncbi:MAG TPA: HlyD family secretion protein [Xanthobacteraceae bacterium]|jgi:multidrug resistance efflux pump